MLVCGPAGYYRVEDILFRSRRAGLIATELIGVRSRKVVPALLDALRDDLDPRIREGAAQALGRLAPKAKANIRLNEVRDGLTTALRTDPSSSVKQAAATALGVYDPENRDTETRELRLVHDLTPSLPVLLAALKDPAPLVSNAAAETIRRMGHEARDAVSDLANILKDPKIDELTRVPVAQALGRIGAPEAVAAVPVLKDVLADTRAPKDVRRAAAESLGRLGKESPEVAQLLGAVLTGTDVPVEVRRAVAAALDQLGDDAKPALPALKKALTDDDKFVRCLAMHTLGLLGKELGGETKDVVTRLLRALDDSVLEVRVAALETFGNLGVEVLGDEAPAVEARVEKMTRDPLKEVREAADNALKKLKKTP
jgi:HEAT repeat protein